MRIIKIPLGTRTVKSGKSSKSAKKGPKKAVKKTPLAPQSRRSSSSSLSTVPDLSGDDGYSAVEDVSESSEDDEDNVIAAEEKHLIDTTPSFPRPGSDLNEDDDTADADEDGMSADDEDDMAVESDDGEAQLSSSSPSWNGFSENDNHPANMTPSSQPLQTPVRHVRFEGVSDTTDSNFEETEDDFYDDGLFPDIFLSQDRISSSLRRDIEQGDDADSSESATYWDFRGTTEMDTDEEENSPVFPFGDLHLLGMDGEESLPSATQENAEAGNPNSVIPDVEEEEEEESDGYQSDGETTEEDEPVALPRRRLPPVQREAPGENPDSDKSSKAQSSNPRPSPVTFGSRNKPICVMNPVTRKMMIFTPRKHRQHRRMELLPGLVSLESLQNCQLFTPDGQSSILSNSGSVMWTGNQLGSFGPTLAPPSMGPPDALFPPEVFFPPSRPSDSEESYLLDVEEDEDENELDLDAFLNLDDGDSEKDIENGDKTDEGNTDCGESSSRRHSTAHSTLSDSNADVHPLLSHLTNNADAVGAFRRNQANQQLILNGQATQESLAFSNPLYNGTLRGIKHGSLGGAATPLTPERRHKKAHAKSPSEAAFKRKAPATAGDNAQSHKRQRSISDVR